MFTGIIKKTSRIESVGKRRGNLAVAVGHPYNLKIEEGQSLSVNGICSTVSACRGKRLYFQYVPETIRMTTVRFWKQGDLINLEESLKFGDALDGHIVTGHIEGVGQITAGVSEGGERLFKIETSQELIANMTKKESITVDGVSLTLADVGENWFSIALIPYTIAHTGWRERKLGDMVNIETDILGRQRASAIVSHAKTSSETQKKKTKRA